MESVTNFKKGNNTFEVLPRGSIRKRETGERLAGRTTHGNKNEERYVEVDQDYSIFKPGSKKEPSSTGAHEIGHSLGILSHEDNTLMSQYQDGSRTLDLNQSQIDAIIQSPIGRDNLMARISKFIEKILR